MQLISRRQYRRAVVRLDNGADANIRTAGRDFPLCCAIRNGVIDSFDKLFEYEARLEINEIQGLLQSMERDVEGSSTPDEYKAGHELVVGYILRKLRDGGHKEWIQMMVQKDIERKEAHERLGTPKFSYGSLLVGY